MSESVLNWFINIKQIAPIGLVCNKQFKKHKINLKVIMHKCESIVVKYSIFHA